MQKIDNKKAAAKPVPTAKPTPAPGKDASKAKLPASGYDAQRAAVSPTSAEMGEDGYDTQRDALRVGGVTLQPLPVGPENEPRRKKKKRKKKKKTNNRNGGQRTPTVTPAPVVTPTPVEPEPAPVEPAPAPVEPAPAPAPLDPMLDPNHNPDPNNEYVTDAHWGEVDGTVAVKGENDDHAIAPDDVKQGSLGDCYFVAQLAAQAKANPGVIEKLIKDNGNGTYTVTLHLKDPAKPWMRKKTDIVVDSKFPKKGGGTSIAYAKIGDVDESGKGELWPMLIEKAFAKYSGSYEEIRGNKTKDGDVFAMMTGKTSGYRSLASTPSEELLRLLTASVAASKPVTFGAIGHSAPDELQKEADKAGVVLNHAYSLEAVDAKAKTISLRNPWGVRHLNGLDVELVRRLYTGVKIGA